MTLTVACATCGARSRVSYGGHCVVCGNGLEAQSEAPPGDPIEAPYCLGCGLGWKPLDRHGFCDYCTKGK